MFIVSAFPQPIQTNQILGEFGNVITLSTSKAKRSAHYKTILRFVTDSLKLSKGQGNSEPNSSRYLTLPSFHLTKRKQHIDQTVVKELRQANIVSIESRAPSKSKEQVDKPLDAAKTNFDISYLKLRCMHDPKCRAYHATHGVCGWLGNLETEVQIEDNLTSISATLRLGRIPTV